MTVQNSASFKNAFVIGINGSNVAIQIGQVPYNWMCLWGM